MMIDLLLINFAEVCWLFQQNNSQLCQLQNIIILVYGTQVWHWVLNYPACNLHVYSVLSTVKHGLQGACL